MHILSPETDNCPSWVSAMTQVSLHVRLAIIGAAACRNVFRHMHTAMVQISLRICSLIRTFTVQKHWNTVTLDTVEHKSIAKFLIRLFISPGYTEPSLFAFIPKTLFLMSQLKNLTILQVGRDGSDQAVQIVVCGLMKTFAANIGTGAIFVYWISILIWI